MLIPIVTYHYVRPNSERFSKNHKSLDIEIFVRQLEFLNKQYSFVYGPQIRDLVSSSPLDKKNPVWLCFDDGYLDHYKYVFPELMSRSAVGSFLFRPRLFLRENYLTSTRFIWCSLRTRTY